MVYDYLMEFLRGLDSFLPGWRLMFLLGAVVYLTMSFLSLLFWGPRSDD